MIGYRDLSVENRRTASGLICSSILSLSVIGPVSQMPVGTVTRPPPYCESVSIAFAKASVFKVTPSPTPPKSAILISRAGICGLCTLAISKGISS